MNLYDFNRALSLLGMMLLIASTGCVRISTYEQVRKEADEAKRQAQELKVSHQYMKQRVEELESTLQNWREQLARTERDWKDVRDGLLRTRIEKELQRQGVREAVFRLDPEKPDLNLEARLRSQPPSLELQHRLKHIHDLLQEVQALLDRY